MISPSNRPLGKRELRRPSTSTSGSCGAALLVACGLACNAVLGIEEADLCSECGDNVGPAGPGQAPLEDSSVDAGGPSDAGGLDEASQGAAGSCTVPASEAVRGCMRCGGEIACDGSCNLPLPPDLGQPCGSCGGSVLCDGSCSARTPPAFGQACGSCGGTIDCSGNCNILTPSDYGSALLRDIPDNFTCCFIDEIRSYGPDGRGSVGCYPGYVYAGCTVSTLSGAGAVSIVGEDPAACTCLVAVRNTGLDGASYEVHLRLTRACNGPAMSGVAP